MKKKTLNVLEGTLSFIGFWDQPIMLDTEWDGQVCRDGGWSRDFFHQNYG